MTDKFPPLNALHPTGAYGDHTHIMASQYINFAVSQYRGDFYICLYFSDPNKWESFKISMSEKTKTLLKPFLQNTYQ